MKRDVENKMLFGVCSGLAKKIEIDPTIVRLIFALLVFMGLGMPIIVYLILAIIMPKE